MGDTRKNSHIHITMEDYYLSTAWL